MFYIILFVLVVQRLGELLLARRNELLMRADGAYEVGADHYKWIVTMHTGWFLSMLAEYHIATPPDSVHPIFFGVFLAAQIMRYYVIATLGRHWNTRILILPGSARVRRGLYRFINHPNYWIVRVEILVIPLMFGLYGTAIAFSILNFFMLRHRIRIENEALAALQS